MSSIVLIDKIPLQLCDVTDGFQLLVRSLHREGIVDLLNVIFVFSAHGANDISTTLAGICVTGGGTTAVEIFQYLGLLRVMLLIAGYFVK